MLLKNNNYQINNLFILNIYKLFCWVPFWTIILICGILFYDKYCFCDHEGGPVLLFSNKHYFLDQGGMKAVLWTDSFQVIMMIVSLLAILIRASVVMGGWDVIWDSGYRTNRIWFTEWVKAFTIILFIFLK